MPKPPPVTGGGFSLAMSRLQILLLEKRRAEEVGDVDLQALAELVDDPQLNRSIGAVHHIPNCRFGNAAAHIKLILGHAALLQKLGKPSADRLV